MSSADLEALYLAHREEIQDYLSRQVRCKDTAADLTQETFIRLSEQLGRTPIDNFRAYLFLCARNLFIDYLRRERHRKGEEVEPTELQALEQKTPSLERTVIAQNQLATLNRVMARMPAPCREVFLLARGEGLTYVEIGERLGISSKTAYSRMVRALELLKLGMHE
ncbi:RNA polymerase sigma factor [Pseudomonas sp. MAFF212428]|uniref:RNA polymerase sigma factor n=1 Tax=Pseudomonas brassicae TaxID=2708063 RepID=A0A6B3NHF1_9PSED|nr:RNA polymerase sigma factor [Pseudomonas brassicae]NER62685.1 RNA polymerase sigma factor [Pseudomonas brassicae]